jgi:hypothetical protein
MARLSGLHATQYPFLGIAVLPEQCVSQEDIPTTTVMAAVEGMGQEEEVAARPFGRGVEAAVVAVLPHQDTTTTTMTTLV